MIDEPSIAMEMSTFNSKRSSDETGRMTAMRTERTFAQIGSICACGSQANAELFDRSGAQDCQTNLVAR